MYTVFTTYPIHTSYFNLTGQQSCKNIFYKYYCNYFNLCSREFVIKVYTQVNVVCSCSILCVTTMGPFVLTAAIFLT